jgi:hypothetical protein
MQDEIASNIVHHLLREHEISIEKDGDRGLPEV